MDNFRKKEHPIVTKLRDLRNVIKLASKNHYCYDLRDLEKKKLSPQFLPRPISREPHYNTFIVEFPKNIINRVII